MNESEIKELILERAQNRKMSCQDAFKISEEFGISRKKIGQFLNELEIKIHSCQLGCFK
ncbi:MAG: hypothetical protein NTY51_02150 [Deltaproteobacteria bacterium]|nr:hypothetical protein [Deltaproteobacteria bacterium]